MATPLVRSFALPGPTGAAQLHGEIRAGGGVRPAVVLCNGGALLAERLARAGFAAVSIEDPGGLTAVLAALAGGALGAVPSAVGVFGRGEGGRAAVRCAAGEASVGALVTWGAAPEAALAAPWLRLDDETEEDEAVAQTVAWFARHLA